MRAEEAKRRRKIEEGLELLGNPDEDPRLADKAFRAAGWSTGLAMAALQEGRYERAANKALEALGRSEEDPLEERGTSLLALRKARRKLPTPDSHVDQAAREERLMARADALLEGLGPGAWVEAEKQVKARCEAYPQLYGPLLTAETGEAERRRLFLAAYRVLAETGDFHEAAELVREGEMKAERGEALTGLALCPCPDCLPALLAPNREDPFDDPWFVARNVQEQALSEATTWSPASGATREETLLGAVACFNLSRYLREAKNRDDLASPALAGAEVRFAALPTLPSLSPEGDSPVPPFVENACRLYFEGLLHLVKEGIPACVERLREAASLETSYWSDLAREKIPGVEGVARRHEDEEKGLTLVRQAEEAQAAGDLAAEVTLLEKLAELGPLFPDEEERFRYLRVATGATSEPSDILRVLKEGSADDRVRTIAREAARRLAREGKAVEGLALVAALGPLETLGQKDLTLFADLSGDAGRSLGRGRALVLLAEMDCSHAEEAVRCLRLAGRPSRARAALVRDLERECRDPGHLWGACIEARAIADPELEERALGRFLETAPAGPRVDEARQRLDFLEAQGRRSRVEAASREALAAAGREDWDGVERALEGLKGERLRPEVLAALAEARGRREAWSEAARLHLRRGPEPEALWKASESFLRAASPREALETLERLLVVAEEEGGGWRARTEGVPPDLAALLDLAMGRREEAARGGDGVAVLSEIVRVARERGDDPAELLALCKLQRRQALDGENGARLRSLLDACPLGEKVRLGLEGERRIVLCDTNILVALTLRALGSTEWLGLGARPEMLEQFDRLDEEGGVPVVSPAVRAEFLGRVSKPPKKGSDAELASLVLKARSVSDPLDLSHLLGREVRASGRHLERVRAFFSRGEMARRSATLTASKVRANPGRAEEVVRRRRMAAADGSGDGSVIHMPEKGDQWLLAEALRLCELPIPGFSSVGILSDDRDFRAFRTDIRREFGISVVGP